MFGTYSMPQNTFLGKDLELKFNEVESNLRNDALGSALHTLKKVAIAAQAHNILEKLTFIEDTYKSLLHYLFEGVQDPLREDVYNDLVIKTDIIYRRLRLFVLYKTDPSKYSTEYNINFSKYKLPDYLAAYSSAISELSLAEIAGDDSVLIKKRIEDLQIQIFNNFANLIGDKNIPVYAMEILNSEKYGENLLPVVISALGIGLLSFYDKYKLTALLDIYDSNKSEKIAASSLVNLFLALMIHGQEISNDKKLILRLETWQDSLLSYQRLREVLFALAKVSDVDRISEKMEKEVIPELKKLNPDIINKMREIGNDIDPEVIENNPEWQEFFDKSGLQDKIREIQEITSSPLDLMSATFANLKQLPFFRTLSNWFIPFTLKHSMINIGESEGRMLDQIFNLGGSVCDSDKYALALALTSMPQSQKNMMLGNIDAQFEQLNGDLQDARLHISNPKFSEEVNCVMRNLYDCCKSNFKDRQEEIQSLFGNICRIFSDTPVVGDILSDEEIVRLLGELYFKRNMWKDACVAFKLLVNSNPTDASALEKLGYCERNIGHFDKALKYFSKAELLKAPSKWLLKELAFVNKQLGRFQDALKYYDMILVDNPDDYNVLVNAGYCAQKDSEYTKALSYYYHANYIYPNEVNAYRGIGWCELINKNLEKSENFYRKVIDLNPIPSDYLNLGHVLFIKKRYTEAISIYRKALSNNKKDFVSAFYNDMLMLKSFGLDERIILYMIDRIMMED